MLQAQEDLLAYGYDGTWYESRPLCVVLPGTVEEVRAIHRVATRERLALTPRAMGSGLSGGSVPLQGSIVLGIMRMNRILEIDTVNAGAVVQPGVVTADLQRAVEALGRHRVGMAQQIVQQLDQRRADVNNSRPQR